VKGYRFRFPDNIVTPSSNHENLFDVILIICYGFVLLLNTLTEARTSVRHTVLLSNGGNHGICNLVAKVERRRILLVRLTFSLSLVVTQQDARSSVTDRSTALNEPPDSELLIGNWNVTEWIPLCERSTWALEHSVS
jgi:hypothetical protein